MFSSRRNRSTLLVLLWDALFSRQYEVNQWLTFKQALALGGNVRKGERGTTVVYADSFVPKKDGQNSPDMASENNPRRQPKPIPMQEPSLIQRNSI